MMIIWPGGAAPTLFQRNTLGGWGAAAPRWQPPHKKMHKYICESNHYGGRLQQDPHFAQQCWVVSIDRSALRIAHARA
jgi:hypothetical protein